MQKPFQLTEAMEKEMSDVLSTALKPGQIVQRTKPVETLLGDRESTHGDFRSNARISQLIKSVFRATEHWQHLDDTEKEAMDMIALKFSRILSGKSLERQHWEDVEGYARLVVKECGQ